MRSGLFVGLALWGSLAIACKGDSGSGKPTNEECAAVGENIAGIILKDKIDHAEAWFDEIKAAPDANQSGLPGDLPRAAFKLWLDSPQGRTWLMKRRTNMLVLVQQAVAGCVEDATKAQVKCLMAAKTKDDVGVCDQKYKKKSAEPASEPAPATVGSAAPAGSGDKPFVPPPTPPNQMAPGDYGPGSSTP